MYDYRFQDAWLPQHLNTCHVHITFIDSVNLTSNVRIQANHDKSGVQQQSLDHHVKQQVPCSSSLARREKISSRYLGDFYHMACDPVPPLPAVRPEFKELWPCKCGGRDMGARWGGRGRPEAARGRVCTGRTLPAPSTDSAGGTGSMGGSTVGKGTNDGEPAKQDKQCQQGTPQDDLGRANHVLFRGMYR